jgi:hypothetical protein
MFENTLYLNFSQGRNSTMKRIMNGTSQLHNVREWLREQQTLQVPPYISMSYYDPSTTKNTTFNMKLNKRQLSKPEPMTSCCCGDSCGVCALGDTACCCSCGLCGCGGSKCCGCGTLITAGNVCMNGTYVIQCTSSTDDPIVVSYLKVSCGYVQYVPCVGVDLYNALTKWAAYYLYMNNYDFFTVVSFVPSGGAVLGTFNLQNCYFWGSNTGSGTGIMDAFTSYDIVSCASMFSNGQYTQGMA